MEKRKGDDDSRTGLFKVAFANKAALDWGGFREQGLELKEKAGGLIMTE